MKIILGISFIAIAAVVVCYFLADFQFNSAKKLESTYQWQKAEAKYRLATKLDPFNAKYLAGYADFLRQKSIYQKDRIGWLERAERSYARAVKLDPRNAEYELSSGQVALDLFSLDKHKFKDSLAYGLNSFETAIKNDPNNADVNDVAWYAAMSVGVDLKAGERPKGSGQSWQGRSRGGDRYEDGNMCWAGTAYRLVDIPIGKAVIKIQAKGSPASHIWPYMIVELSGVEIGEGFVDSSEWKDYSFSVDMGGGVKVLSVTFTNDAVNPQRNEDRNLFVGGVLVEKP